MYRYFMLQDGLFFVYLHQNTEYYLCLIELKNRGFNLFFSEKLR
ncbi:hypothetical protein [Klebsiella pneumoniae IS53]|nr:hypothetical protein [Klebsiella pneumoniae IS53]